MFLAKVDHVDIFGNMLFVIWDMSHFFGRNTVALLWEILRNFYAIFRQFLIRFLVQTLFDTIIAFYLTFYLIFHLTFS